MGRIPRRARRGQGAPARARDHAQPAEALEGTAPRRADGPDDGLHQHDRARERARVPRRRGDRAPLPRLDPLERGHASCTARSAPASRSAATSRPTRRPPPSTRSASTTSSAARTTPAAATRSSSRATPPPAPTPAPSSRAGSATDQLDGFRQEKSHAPDGLSSYPHPRLMPEFWQFPTVSMGLGPINAIYQAQANRYLTNRGIKDASDQHVWAFLGDGEMDEVESRGQLQVAANEGLDNLTFVINCNLQRLDGPVRGNGKIIQELESFFRGAGWNVIKVVWGREWDDLLARDHDGALRNLMNVTPDGDYQTYKAEIGRLRARELLRPRPARARARQGPHRRPDLEPQARRPRLPQGVRGVQGGHRAQGPAHRHPGEDDQGLRPRTELRGPQRDPPDEEDDARQPQDVPRRDAHPDHRRAARGEPVPAAVLPPRRPGRGDPVPARASSRARRLPARAPHEPHRDHAARRLGLRDREEGLRHAGDRHDHGVRAAAEGPDARQGLRQPHRADHPRRGAHLRHGRVLPEREDLQPERPALHLGRPRAAPGLQGEPAGPDRARRHQRGRRARRVHRHRHVVRDRRASR